ncbi:MFS transporter [Dictyobacter vulcani]|uniref:MFS transporter n=1 Tax=Dictyobacter vulcani TaxID=2607529 RepID=A0A5J4KJY7_9CHLR|nr:MFS transporter [Dictyobacter vulcani]GER86747.1 MFS transporter [Dictyobacter vulcani]
MNKECIDIVEPIDVVEEQRKEPAALDKRLVFIMAIACALSVANLYYIQPLLAIMGQEFAVSANQMGFIATMGQIGYACGLLFIIPLGDKYNQRKLIVGMLIAVTLALVFMASAPSIMLITVASFLVGVATVVPQLIIPYAASLASARERGQVVGTVMSGLLIGILLARTISGLVAAHSGWRAMYWIAAAMMVVLAILMRFLLPSDKAKKGDMSYPRLLSSLWGLVREEPVLREVMLFGAMAFAAFSAFWVALSFLLATPPYHFGSEVAGLFGLVGVAGALAASFVGKFADRRDPRAANGLALVIVLLAFVCMWLTGQWLFGLIIGTILLDLGTQANQISSQARIYSMRPEARNRLNTAYMFFYFVGGSLGSLLGTLGWSLARWNGVCAVASLMLLIALGFYALNTRKMRMYLQSRT